MKKFCRVDKHLRIAVGTVFGEGTLPQVTERSRGIAEIRTDLMGTTKVYLDLERGTLEGENYVDKVEITIPLKLRKAPYREILFNDNKLGARVLFGRHGEDMPFSFNFYQRYIMLRLYPETPDCKFEPLYVRVDQGEEKHFFCLKARWVENVITLEIEREPEEKEVPLCLIEA